MEKKQPAKRRMRPVSRDFVFSTLSALVAGTEIEKFDFKPLFDDRFGNLYDFNQLRSYKDLKELADRLDKDRLYNNYLGLLHLRSPKRGR